ncbi:hypothetical protein P9851_01730 [Geobacillus stearothermophilus]|uniref:Phospholipase A2 domain-containing protein n=1 Tax=Parageobacillus toebii TaxID=153151 RepID=A0A150MH81_9BACL|nr:MULTISPECIES: hypothetical protein [Bacillaceae]KYD23937.1 hypothetical protein B4110_3842 [Parageobacillus toebii]MED5076059.1 hypothetical protein [Geobacillus stearothermophilus]
MAVLIKSQELETESKNALLEELNNSDEFALLVSEISRHHTVKDVKETDALKLTFGTGKTIDAIFVKLNDEAIIQALKDEDEFRIKAHFSALKNRKKVIRKAIVKDNSVEIEFEIPFEASYFLFVEELKNPMGADKITEGEIAPEAWYEGCLVFYDSGSGKYYYYKYCGAKCGSGTPINALDRCCQAHDRCWANFGKGDDGCDYELYLCANATYDPGWWMVAEFGLLCSQGKLGSIC